MSAIHRFRGLAGMLGISAAPGGGSLVRNSAAVFLVNGIGQVLAFGLQWLLASLLGIGGFGVYSYALAWFSVALVMAKCGVDIAATRFVPAYRATGEHAHAHGMLRFARSIPVAIGLGLALLAAGGWSLMRDPGEAAGAAIVLFLLVVPLAAFSELTAVLCRALGSYVVPLLGDNLLRPLLMAAVLLAAYHLAGGFGPLWAIFAFGVGTVGSALFASALLRRISERMLDPAPAKYAPREWFAVALPMLLAGGFQILIYSIDTLMLGALRTTNEAGVFALASRIAGVAMFVMNAVQLVAAPQMSTAFATGARDDLQRIVTISARLSALAAGASLMGAVVFGRWVLGLFGEEFEAGYAALCLLMLAQFVNACTGSSGFVLGLGGQQNRLVWLIGLGVVLSVILNAVLVPTYGLWGAAMSALVAHSVWNLLAARACWARLGVNVFAFARLPARAH